ncbi:hypothetical protein BKA67DRAFT_328227 [Truncatella angustata]|uniref:Uncharacterized protein n=1 Tax=Truncatella angustata TaxID=152316 RepID=A0A9P8UK14_9PEZI|nr:uncharacterized protein BKA67DRAFT_328227 [Truncatella angustata]KAH6653665.1 hypothetical protein BKA67DRAFT_328227 [Truncatella angustata]
MCTYCLERAFSEYKYPPDSPIIGALMAAPVNDVPFKRTDALNDERLTHTSDYSTNLNPLLTAPQNDHEIIDHIPGEPTIPFRENEIFLQKELTTPVLDELFDKYSIFQVHRQ